LALKESVEDIIIDEGMRLRETMKITFFDSLHASTALLNNQGIISTDSIYGKVECLTWIAPEQLNDF
jgi:predicted nucleic acid-binding protein